MECPPPRTTATEGPAPETFHWSVAAEFLTPWIGWLEPEERGRFFRGRSADGWDVRCTPPAVLPMGADGRSLEEFVAACPDELGLHLVLLMQAGAVSLGLFRNGEALATKSLKRYVVRGKGRAQPTHLERKGKSRYGSRLRLQNAKRLLEETNAKLRGWQAEHGPFERIFYNAPVRLWPSLFEVALTPPFDRDGPLVKIPLDLPRPTTDILLRAYRRLCWGRLETAPARPLD